jgi:hypothetical protein
MDDTLQRPDAISSFTLLLYMSYPWPGTSQIVTVPVLDIINFPACEFSTTNDCLLLYQCPILSSSNQCLTLEASINGQRWSVFYEASAKSRDLRIGHLSVNFNAPEHQLEPWLVCHSKR